MAKSYYDILGVKNDATEDDIKKAWKKIRTKLHPDKGGNQEAFKEAKEAYEVLSDPQKRHTYDTYGSSGPQPESPFGPRDFGPDLDEILRTLRGQMGGFHGARADVHVGPNGEMIQKITVPVDVMIKGGDHRFRYFATKNNDNFSNFSFSHSISQVTLPSQTPVGYRFTKPEIPNTQFIVIPGSIPSCNVQGLDLVVKHDFDALRIAAGMSVSVPHPDGQRYEVKIPSNFRPGGAVRLSGKGLQHINGAVGNFLVAINLTIPILSDEKKQALKDLIES